MILRKPKSKLGPYDHGRKMSLRAFEFAPVEEGYLFELARGFVVVSEVANYYHAMQIVVIMEALWAYKIAHPTAIHAILEGASSKLPVPKWESERHADIAVYLTRPKGKKDRTLWRSWLPELIAEVVSESSRDRDYTEKREEYWTLGVKEYWIVDAKLQQVVILRRGKSDWIEKSLGPDDTIETKLLPGFQLACQAIFDAAEEEADKK
jgi:hypothetical protein